MFDLSDSTYNKILKRLLKYFVFHPLSKRLELRFRLACDLVDRSVSDRASSGFKQEAVERVKVALDRFGIDLFGFGYLSQDIGETLSGPNDRFCQIAVGG